MFHEDHFGVESSNPRSGDRRRRGPGPHGGPGGRHRAGVGRRGRQRRGDVRAAVLLLLDEEPRNGYQLIQELATRSNQVWMPSPGSIYPVLQQLEDEGLITVVGGSGRTFTLTDDGRAYVAERRAQLGRPWESSQDQGNGPLKDVMVTAREVMLAARQVVVAGSDAQVAQATALLSETRRALYRLLADGDTE